MCCSRMKHFVTKKKEATTGLEIERPELEMLTTENHNMICWHKDAEYIHK